MPGMIPQVRHKKGNIWLALMKLLGIVSKVNKATRTGKKVMIVSSVKTHVKN
jgi:hypothetical protein